MDFKQGGQAIQRIRKERGLTQEQLAEMTDVASNSISRIERGLLIPVHIPAQTCQLHGEFPPIVPISLFASMIDTSSVSPRRCFSNVSAKIKPC